MSEIAALPGGGPSAVGAASRRPASEAAAALVWQWQQGAAPDPRPRPAAAARRRGAIGALVGLLIAAALFHWRPRTAEVVAVVAVLTGLLALVSPLGGYRQLMRAVDAFARWVGTTMTWVLMSVVWLLVFLPVGLLLRAGHKLRITRAPEPRLPSYWSAATKVDEGIAPYQKPF